MKIHLLFFSFFTVPLICFSQDSIKNNRSIFFNGISLKNPNYNFEWNFQINDIPRDKFLNFNVDKQKFGVWMRIKFDSAIFFNDFLLNRIIISGVKKKKDDQFIMNGFVGIVDLETINKMAVFFNYRWESRGWMNYPIENPLYKIRPYKNKKEGAILIARL